jgi:hypothetical protein
MNSFVQELRRRNVHWAAAGYVLFALVIVSGAALVFPRFDLPNWTLPVVIIFILAGFPAVLISHLYFDVTAGLKRKAVTIAPPANFLPLLASGSVLLSVIIGTVTVPRSYEFMAKMKSPPSDAEVSTKVKEVLWLVKRDRPDPEQIPGSAKLHGPSTPAEESLGLDHPADLSVLNRLNDYIHEFQPGHKIRESEYGEKKRVIDLIELVRAKVKPDPSKTGKG